MMLITPKLKMIVEMAFFFLTMPPQKRPTPGIMIRTRAALMSTQALSAALIGSSAEAELAAER